MESKNDISDEEIEDVFSSLDERGVVDPDPHIRQREREEREEKESIDPLSAKDPSGSNVGKTILRAAVTFILIVLIAIVGSQIAFGLARRLNTANLSEQVDMESVTRALDGGVSWGDGFTQFPDEYRVNTADQDLGVIDVTVIDTTADNETELLAGSQIQATALATNALLNEHIDKVAYHVCVYVDEDGEYKNDRFWGFLPPTGEVKSVFTFIWTKNVSENPFALDWDCRIIGADNQIIGNIQDQINSASTPIGKHDNADENQDVSIDVVQESLDDTEGLDENEVDEATGTVN